MTNFILIQQLELTGFNPRMYENVSRTTHARHYSRGRVDMGGWVRVWLCTCGVRVFHAAWRVRVVSTRACVDLFASAGSRGSSLP